MKKAFLQLHASVFLAGFTGILGRLVIDNGNFNAGMIVWYRLLFTSLLMWLIFSLRRKMHRISKKDRLAIAGVGMIAALHWVTFYASIEYANVSVALVCFASIGLFTALFEPLILRKRIDRLELALGLITIGAIYLIFHFDAQYKTGIIIGVISALLASLFPIYNRELLKRTNVETLLAWQQSGGFLMLTLLLPFYLAHYPVVSFFPKPVDLLWLLILAFFCSVIAFQLSANALKKLSAFTVNLTFNLEPVYGVILAFAIMKENQFLNKWFYVGFAIIVFTLIVHACLLVRKRKQEHHE